MAKRSSLSSLGTGASHAPIVCHLTSSHRALDDRIFFREVLSLTNHGYRCTVVGIHPKAEEIIEGVKIYGIRAYRNRFEAYITHPIRALRRSFFTGATVFHFHDPTLLVAGLLLKLAGKRVIYDVHDDYQSSVYDRLWRMPRLAELAANLWWPLELIISSMFDGIIVADRYLATRFNKLNPTILGNFPRRDFTTPADSSHEKTFNIIYVGGIQEARGLGKVLDAMECIPDHPIRFHVIGDGRDPKLLQRLKCNSRVVLHGRVPWTNLHAYYRRAHVGVALYQPRRSFLYYPGENAVKILEYMAAGIPVLCSNFEGLKEFVEKAGVGLTVQPDDPKAIAEKILYLYHNPELRQALGHSGRRAFEEKYNWEKHEHKLIRLYKRVLKNGDHSSQD